MFRRLHDPAEAVSSTCRFEFDGQFIAAHPGETVAAALLRSDTPICRTHPVDGSPRAPFCMMGVCQECLVCVNDGLVRRACLLPVSEGLRVSRPQGRASSP